MGGKDLGEGSSGCIISNERIERTTRIDRGVEWAKVGGGETSWRRAREYAGVNTSHEFRLVCEQNRTTSRSVAGPLNYCPVIGMIIGSN